MKKILTIVGARPQFIKASILSMKLKGRFEEILIHTGQHYDENMSDIFFEQMNLPKPKYNLNIGSGSHGFQTGKMLIELEKIILKENPDAVIVYGDTNTTVAGALASSKLLIPLIHIESGLRSYNMNMPEEQNRIVTDHLSTFLFCPTKTAVNNLKKEGIETEVYNVGDIMYDSTIFFGEISEEKFTNKFPELKYYKKSRIPPKWCLLTLHRAENTEDENILKEVLNTLEKLKIKTFFPVHPRIKAMFTKLEKENNYKNILAVEPVDYITMLYLTKNAEKVITDSGGLQKECYFLNTPCITVRDETEWVETLKNGYNILSSSKGMELYNKIVNAKIISSKKANYFGDGKTSDKIVEILEEKI